MPPKHTQPPTRPHRSQREVPPNAYRAQYGYVLCRADALAHPSSTAEVAAAIKEHAAAAAAQGRAFKARASRK